MTEVVCVDVSPRLITEKEFLLQFISVYRELPELWNMRCEDYRDKRKRALAINKMLEVLRLIHPYITQEDIKKKINILRTTFNRENNKIKKSRLTASSPSEIYVPTVWYFNELSFLADQPEDESANITIESQAEAWNQLSVHLNSVHQPKVVNSSQVCLPLSQVLDEGESDTNSADGVNQLCTPSVSFVTSACKPEPSRKKIKFEPIARWKDPLQLPYSVSERSSSKPEQEIPTVVKLWCEKLVTLAPKQRIFAEKAINDVLFEASLGTLHRHSVTINSSSSVSNASSPSPRQTFCSSCAKQLTVVDNEVIGTEKDNMS